MSLDLIAYMAMCESSNVAISKMLKDIDILDNEGLEEWQKEVYHMDMQQSIEKK